MTWGLSLDLTKHKWFEFRHNDWLIELKGDKYNFQNHLTRLHVLGYWNWFAEINDSTPLQHPTFKGGKLYKIVQFYRKSFFTKVLSAYSEYLFFSYKINRLALINFCLILRLDSWKWYESNKMKIIQQQNSQNDIWNQTSHKDPTWRKLSL